MFTKAYKITSKFTLPFVISTKTKISSKSLPTIGTFVVVNEDGWALTAGHIFLLYESYLENKKKIDDGNTESLGNDDIIEFSFWFGHDTWRLGEYRVNYSLDLALFKIKNFEKDTIEQYPIFKRPENLEICTNLCRIGFAFPLLETKFDEEKRSFNLNIKSLTLIPNDAIYTRNIFQGKTSDEFDILYLETSTPGLKGQSGGPIFDKFGNICAIQVKTSHIPLDFHPEIPDQKGNMIIENQVINYGLGVHVKTLMEFMDRFKVKYSKEKVNINAIAPQKIRKKRN